MPRSDKKWSSEAERLRDYRQRRTQLKAIKLQALAKITEKVDALKGVLESSSVLQDLVYYYQASEVFREDVKSMTRKYKASISNGRAA
jgi:hypothetical protein